MSNSKNVREALKEIPSVDRIIKGSIHSNYIDDFPYDYLTETIRTIISSIRNEIMNNNIPSDVKSYTINKIKSHLEKIKEPSLKSVINGTGIILNTGLGRAPLSKEILLSVADTIFPYCNLEVDIETNTRGNRLEHLQPIINSLVDSESSLVVNNNAAAVMLMLNSLSKNKDVIISRGQQVEIGGSFRIPEIIKKSGCKMIEIGTTNKTHLSDYKKVINKNTSAILYVHTSNYKIIGFTEEVKIKELSKLCKEHDILLLCDLGSGSIYSDSNNNLPFEREVKDYIKDGVDVVTYSGDKLLGSIQSGIISGKKSLIEKMYRNSMYRTLRVDKYRVAILEKILRTYISRSKVSTDNISIHFLNRPVEELKAAAELIISKINGKIINKYDFNIESTVVEAGSGSLPTEKIKSVAISIKSDKDSANIISNKLRGNSIPIITYINSDKVYIDFKAIHENQYKIISQAINKCL